MKLDTTSLKMLQKNPTILWDSYRNFLFIMKTCLLLSQKKTFLIFQVLE